MRAELVSSMAYKPGCDLPRILGMIIAPISVSKFQVVDASSVFLMGHQQMEQKGSKVRFV